MTARNAGKRDQTPKRALTGRNQYRRLEWSMPTDGGTKLTGALARPNQLWRTRVTHWERMLGHGHAAGSDKAARGPARLRCAAMQGGANSGEGSRALHVPLSELNCVSLEETQMQSARLPSSATRLGSRADVSKSRPPRLQGPFPRPTPDHTGLRTSL
ncbi:hypothetical protein MRX96_048902 [Rhipicephalus microplus]